MSFSNDENDKEGKRERILKKMERTIVNDWIGLL